MNTTDTVPAPGLDRNPDATLRGKDKARYVSGMFARIAARYDLMNSIMSFGQDSMWRRV